ncbi:MAG: hypothetical protein HFG71_05500 [Hungatella sp.]|nr:hypothetical protein [Hungatella sp.]
MLMRASLLHYVRKDRNDPASERRYYGLCGGILLFMNVVLSVIIILVVHKNSEFRRYQSPVLSAAKVINQTAALASMLSLETAMLTQFGAGDNPGGRQIMTACTGAGISMIVLGMAILPIDKIGKMRYDYTYKNDR